MAADYVGMTGSPAVTEALDRTSRAVAAEHACDPGLLQGYLPALLASAGSLRRLTEDETKACRLAGGEAARSGLSLPALVDLYMTASRRLWPQLSGLVGAQLGRSVRPTELVPMGDAVWRSADDALAALAAGYLDAQRLVVRAEEAERLQFIDDLLRGSADTGYLVDRADAYGLNLAAGHVVVVAQAERPVAPAGRLTARVEQAARSRFPGRGVLVTADAGRLVCAVSTTSRTLVHPDGDGGVLAELTASAAAGLAPDEGWRVAVSRAHAGPRGISRGYAEARDALDVAGRLDLPGAVVHAAHLLVYRVLLRDEGAMTDLVQAVLGPLATTGEGPERLLGTLEAYFAEAGNSAAAARRLHLSVRALGYRLQRVEQLTGYRAGDPAQQLTLSVAVTGARLLGWTGSTPSDG